MFAVHIGLLFRITASSHARADSTSPMIEVIAVLKEGSREGVIQDTITHGPPSSS